MIKAYKLTDELDLVKVFPGERVDTVKDGMYLVSVPSKELEMKETIVAFVISHGKTKIVEKKLAQISYIDPDEPLWLIMPYSTRRAIWPDEPSMVDARERALGIAKVHASQITAR